MFFQLLVVFCYLWFLKPGSLLWVWSLMFWMLKFFLFVNSTPPRMSLLSLVWKTSIYIWFCKCIFIWLLAVALIETVVLNLPQDVCYWGLWGGEHHITGQAACSQGSVVTAAGGWAHVHVAFREHGNFPRSRFNWPSCHHLPHSRCHMSRRATDCVTLSCFTDVFILFIYNGCIDLYM